MAHIVITGGAGFIGSHLVDRALAEGHDVTAIDNLITGDERNLAHVRDNPRFTFTLHDVSTTIEIERGVDVVFHFASPASPVDYARHPIKTLKVGSLGTHNVLGLAKAKGATVVLASTSEVYGDPLVHPQTEEYWGNVNPIGPRSCYDEAKRFAEAIAMAYHRRHGVRTRIVRIFNTYGPRMRLRDGRVLPNFLCQALEGRDLTIYGDGSQTRAFCYVDDLVEGIWRMPDLPDDPYPVNLGNPAEVTIAEFAEIVVRVTGSTSGTVLEPLPEDDPKRRRPNIDRARAVLEWEPRIDLEAGLTRTIPDFRARLGMEVTS